MEPAANRLDRLDWSAELSKPDFRGDYDAYDAAAPEHQHMLAGHGIFIHDRGQNNCILLEKNFPKLRDKVEFSFDGTDSIVALGATMALNGAINCSANSVAVIGGYQHSLNLNVFLYPNGKLFWGRHARTFGCRIWADGGKSVVVGDDCLFSEAIQIRTSDHHSLIDLDSYEQQNFPADVTVSRHVWVGPNVSIGKGVTIGRGSIISAGAHVSRDVPGQELWGGLPARAIKRRVSWVDSHPAAPDDIAQLRRMVEEDEW